MSTYQISISTFVVEINLDVVLEVLLVIGVDFFFWGGGRRGTFLLVDEYHIKLGLLLY